MRLGGCGWRGKAIRIKQLKAAYLKKAAAEIGAGFVLAQRPHVGQENLGSMSLVFRVLVCPVAQYGKGSGGVERP